MTRVAITGIGCRVRGARTSEDLQRALARPGAFTALPAERWDATAFGPPPSALLLDDFDVDFRAFRLPPAQIANMHRMERAALGAMHEALVDAGRGELGAWGERTMVHMAASSLGLDPTVDHLARVRLHEAEDALREAARDLDTSSRDAALRALEAAAPPISVDSLMTTAGMTAGRLANAFDLGGGHFAYDAGGASSLAALAGATAALEEGTCDLAIVGALSTLVTATAIEAYRRRRLYANDTSFTLGTLLGEGAISIVLEREDDAGARGRRIYAVLCGVGRSAAGRRGPVTASQDLVERAARVALDASRFSPADIDYVEWQGAGLGSLDEGERAALLTVYGAPGARAVPLSRCATSLGYLGAAAGLASVAAAALAIDRGARANVSLSPLRRVAVSSIGLGGVAHHAILASRDDVEPRALARTPRDQRIAIVGLGAVMPGAPDVASLWKLVNEGNHALTPIAPERWNAARFMTAAARGRDGAVHTTLAGQVPNVLADAALLRLPPASLPYVDGSIVLTAQAAAQAIADAGLSPDADPQRIGVVVGHLPLRSAEFTAERRSLAARAAATIERALEHVEPAVRKRVAERVRARLEEGVAPLREETLETMSSLAGAARVAARFDFRGDVLAVDAACASSLVALRHGVQALQRGELDTVVVAASAYNLVPEYYIALSTLGALAQTGSRPFDGGDGMVPAEGAGALVLRRLSDAVRDKQRVYAVVRSVALSSDGRGTALLAPSSRGQRRALERAYDAAGIVPTEIDLLEAHGTGTVTGDAVELETYGALFAGRAGDDPIQLGSVKSNIGHLSSAAGMAGVIKAVLALHHRVLPPTRHSGNTPAGLTTTALRLGTQPRPWREPSRGARVAGVSAFGLGGINAHVVLEEHVPQERRRAPRSAPPAPSNSARLVVELAPLSMPDGLPRIPTGPVLLIGDSSVRTAIETQLRAANVAYASHELPDEPLERAEARARALFTAHPDAAVIDLRALAKSTDATIALRRIASLVRATYGRWEESGGRLLVATAMGGGLGFLAGDRVAEGGALAGFCKALRFELPKLESRVVDVDPADDPAWIASTLLTEFAAGGERAEVGYVTRRRVVPVLRLAPLPTQAPPLTPIEAGQVVLFSGGGRGVVFECARALAQRGVVVIVTGRFAPVREPWIELDEASFAAGRDAALHDARRADPTLTPARFNAQWDARLNARELHRNLVTARAEKIPLHYRTLDVTQAEACRALVAEIRREFGRLDGIVHGAMFERSRALPQKSASDMDATLRTKVDGLQNLLVATWEAPPRFVVAFGSIAGRLGNRGQTDYAAANDAMARLLAHHGQRHRETHCATLEWTAWGSVGAAARARTAELLHNAGIEPIPLTEGVRRFVEELTHGPASQSFVLVCPERQAHDWPRVERVRDVSTRAAATIDDRGQPLYPADWPFVDIVLPVDAEGRAVVERLVEAARDRYLGEHRVEGVPYLPGAFAAELLAEAAAIAHGGQQVHELRDVRIESPLRFTERAAAPLLRVTLKSGPLLLGRRAVDAELRVASGPATPSGLQRVRVRGTVVVGPAAATRELEPLTPLPIAPPRAKSPSLFSRMEAPLKLGAPFQRIEGLERPDQSARTIRAQLSAPDLRELFTTTTSPRLLVNPLLLDAAFQVASHLVALRPNGFVAIPVGFARLRVGEQTLPGAPIYAQAELVSEGDDELVADVQVEQGNAVCIRVEGLRLRRLLETAQARFAPDA